MRPFQSVRSLANNLNDPALREIVTRVDNILSDVHGAVARLASNTKPDTSGSPVVVIRVPGGSSSSGVTVQTVRTTIDQAISTATLTDVTNLSFALTAGGVYHFKFVMMVRSDTATVGVKVGLTTPTMTTFAGTVSAVFAADGAAATWSGALTSSGDAVVPTDIPAINTDYIATIEGVAFPSANGNLQVQAATETGTTTVTIRNGTCGLLTLIV